MKKGQSKYISELQKELQICESYMGEESHWSKEFDRLEDMGQFTSQEIHRILDHDFFPVDLAKKKYVSSDTLRNHIRSVRQKIDFLLDNGD